MLRVSVTDSGIGIPIDKQALVFERSRQADSSTTRRYGGTGLGLAICRQLATLMDGDIGLESTEGVGSTFWFAIPLAAAPVPKWHRRRGRRAGRGRAPARTTVALLVEDNPTNQFVARRFIEKAGCVVDVAANGAEALERIAARDYDLVFMDCQMPIMDGYEATKRIRQGASVVGADHRHDRPRDEGRSRALPGRGDDRLSVEAAEAGYGGGDDRARAAAAGGRGAPRGRDADDASLGACLRARPSGGRG